MLNVSTAFKRKLYNDERDYINTLIFTLSDSTTLTVTHEHIMDGGILLDDAIGDDSSFTALGSTVCNSLEITLYNNDEIYSDYVFENATCIYTVGLNTGDEENPVIETIRKGTFTVDSATYSDYTITLTMLDNMEQFDRPYTSTLVYPATLAEIVRGACIDCGVTLSPSSQTFPHYNYSISSKPSDEDTTYREVLGWCATIAGCFAKCDVQGRLELKWFNTTALEDDSNEFDGGVFDSSSPYSTGDEVDGGTFNPWNLADEVDGDEFTTVIPYHYITDLISQSIGVDDIVITGVSISVKNDDEDATDDIVVHSSGTSNFMIQIADNPLITEDNVTEILGWLATQLIGLTFRQCDVTHPSDPSIEAGDVGLLWDKKGVEHPILITRVTFSPTSSQTVVCGAESVSKNNSTRSTEATKAYIETRKQLKQQKNSYDDALDNLRELVNNAEGLYETQQTVNGAVITYLHNKPLLAESDIQIKVSTAGVTVTANGTATTPTWYGLTVDGQFLASVIQTISLFFDYASGGTLTLGGSSNGNGVLRILNASGTEIGRIDNTGANLNGQIELQSSTGLQIATIGSADTFSYNPSLYWKTSNSGFFLKTKSNTGKLVALHMWPSSRIYFEQHSFCASKYYFRSIELAPDYTDIESVPNGQYPNHKTSYCAVVAEKVYVGTNSSNSNYINYTIDGILGNNLGGSYTYGSGHFELNFRSDTNVIKYNNTALAFDSSSSKRYKDNINKLIDESLDPHKLLELEVKQFKYKKDFEQLQYKDMKDQLLPGFIAEEVNKIYPSAVIHNDNGEIESWDERRIIPGMLSLIQEQHEKIEEQAEQIKSLESRLEKLESFIFNLTDDGR